MDVPPELKGTLTVQQLIDALSAVEDKSLPVITEGCDCSGPAASVRVQPEEVIGGLTYPACVSIDR